MASGLPMVDPLDDINLCGEAHLNGGQDCSLSRAGRSEEGALVLACMCSWLSGSDVRCCATAPLSSCDPTAVVEHDLQR